MLRSRDDTLFTLGKLPDACGGAVCWPSGDHWVIIIDVKRTRRERLALLAHELLHIEFGAYAVPCTTQREQHIAREECRVDDEVARRLVPSDELAAMYELAIANDLPVELWQVADRFDVPDDVAERAMRMFLAYHA